MFSEISSEIRSMLAQTKTTLRGLQSISGLLNFACAVVLPGRPFLRRLIDRTLGVAAPHFRLRLTSGMLEDLRMWLRFLHTFNGRSVFPDPRQLSPHDILLYTDVSGSIEYRAVFGTKWFNGKWSKWWIGQNITLLELYPIVVAIETWGRRAAE